MQVLGWIFLPVFIASGVNTLPEYMTKRFGGKRIRIYLAGLSLILYVFTKISVNLYAGALFIQQALNWNLYISVLLILIVTAMCTLLGGLAAVIYTDTLQAFIMMIGAMSLSIISFVKVGGYKGLYDKYQNAIPNSTLNNPNTTCGLPPNDSWIMLRDPTSNSMPWPGFLFGQTPASIWYWCADQMMVQRTLAAKNLSHAQGGTLVAGFFKLLPFFIMVLPGMISRVLFPNEVACATPAECEKYCGSKVSCTNIAYPKLVLELMPDFMRGVMLSVMLSALISDLTSIFNSASTLFTLDFYATFKKKTSNRELMIVGRVAVVFLTIIGIVWIPVVESMQGGQLYIYIQSISAYLAPPIAAIYLMAILVKKCNEIGAFSGLITGFIAGVIRMILDFVYKEPSCGEVDQRPQIIRIHYMYFASYLFWQSIIVSLIVSLITKPPSPEKLICTTFWTRFNKKDGDKFELEDIKPEVEDTPKRNRKIIDWLCGLDASTSELRNAKDRLRAVQSLEQGKTAKILLRIVLGFLLLLSVFLYIFFSSNHFGLLD